MTSPPRLAAMTTQFALSSGVMPYASQNCAVSDSAGSIAATRTWSAHGSCPQRRRDRRGEQVGP